ncbi:hypothetical protein D3C81_1244200 [compost metagenome]
MRQQRIDRQCHRRAAQVFAPQQRAGARLLGFGQERCEQAGAHRLAGDGRAQPLRQLGGRRQAGLARALGGVAGQVARGVFIAADEVLRHQRVEFVGHALRALQHAFLVGT